MDEQKIYELLSSGNTNKENEGLEMLNQEKARLMQKHSRRIPPHFNDEESVFYYGIRTLLEIIRADRFEYRSKGSLEAFLFTLIDRKILNELRRKKLDELSVLHENLFSIIDKPFDKEILENVSHIFREKLGETCQKVLIMRFYEGMKLKEIAEEMNFTLGTIRNNSSECMKKLQKLIKEDPNLEDYLKKLLED